MLNWPELLKMCALAAVAALLGAHWLGPLDTALVGVVVFYLLTVRAG